MFSLHFCRLDFKVCFFSIKINVNKSGLVSIVPNLILQNICFFQRNNNKYIPNLNQS